MPPHALAAALSLVSLSLSAPALAQIGLAASVDSDDRFRGVSLSDERPILGLQVSYDHPEGVYAGANFIAVDTAHEGLQALGHVAYLGYARRSGTGPTWDIGVTNAELRNYAIGRHSINYSEAYAGILTEHISARIFYSPGYFGGKLRTVYAELNGAVRPAPDWRLFGHMGVLTPVGGWAPPGARGERYDLSAGLARQLGAYELRLAWTSAIAQPTYAGSPRQSHDALVVGASRAF